MNANMDDSTVSLLTLNTLNVADKLTSVTLQDLTGLLSLVVTSGDHDLIVLSDWNRTYVIFFTEFLAQWCAHDLPADVRWRGEVTLTILSSGTAN